MANPRFEALMALFAKHHLPLVDPPEQKDASTSMMSWSRWFGHDVSFVVHGPRDSVIHYRIWGKGTVEAWFGHGSHDSGGIALQGYLPGRDDAETVEPAKVGAALRSFITSGHA